LDEGEEGMSKKKKELNKGNNDPKGMFTNIIKTISSFQKLIYICVPSYIPMQMHKPQI
jgi:hypothetical protein